MECKYSDKYNINTVIFCLFQSDSCVFRPESSGIPGIPRNSWIPAGIRGIRPESVEEWKVLEIRWDLE